MPNAAPRPAASRAPVPVFLLINNRPATNTDPTRKEKSGFWPAEQMIARGYGIAAIQYGQLAPDDKDRYREGAMTLFDGAASAGPGPTWGAIAAWAWGASRALDYLVTDARVDNARVGIVGHSRGGKAALWAGAEDERFALVVSNESGEGGAALSRRWFGETVERINTSFPHWFTAKYKSFNGREASLPIDQHMLLALTAPRALYVASADEDLWSDPRGEFLSLVETSPVFALWGEPPLAASQMPALDRPLIVGRRGYHIRTGAHNLTPYDWDRIADFADRVWPRPHAGNGRDGGNAEKRRNGDQLRPAAPRDSQSSESPLVSLPEHVEQRVQRGHQLRGGRGAGDLTRDVAEQRPEPLAHTRQRGDVDVDAIDLHRDAERRDVDRSKHEPQRLARLRGWSGRRGRDGRAARR